ncbi:MAG TPA: anthranilate phosphoribosyltransferase [Thermoanaerobaculaceae bacterium]|nr:anthranilate phosphoribosyltransferase [Thermoanaerobaculaceae bacterium]HRS16135.1 anthranilate phosphoribosyltransferase [Thermoanaerobaculaceae bacterium]
MLNEVLNKLMERNDLSADEAEAAVERAVGGADPHQVAALLVLLRAKGETAEEVGGMAAALQRRALKLGAGDGLVDTCGTGGDGANTVNLSTGAAILAAACGVRVAKHGNRSVSSRCGSADVLEALGVAIELPAAAALRCLEEVGITFLFAPAYHPALKVLAPVRRGLGVRTVFNLLGPLLNPAGTRRQVLGVAQRRHMPLLAGALQRLGVEHALVVHAGGLDELTPAAAADCLEVRPDGLRELRLDPGELGVPPCRPEALAGGEPATNAVLLRRALEGEPGAVGDAIALNAGAALYVAGRAASVQAGVEAAREALAAGRAAATLDLWVACSRRLAAEAA